MNTQDYFAQAQLLLLRTKPRTTTSHTAALK